MVAKAQISSPNIETVTSVTMVYIGQFLNHFVDFLLLPEDSEKTYLRMPIKIRLLSNFFFIIFAMMALSFHHYLIFFFFIFFKIFRIIS